MSAIACLAWILSVTPLCLLRFPEAGAALSGASPVQWVLLPWLALAGLPRPKLHANASAWAQIAFWIAWSAPPTALGLSLAAEGDGLVRFAAASTALHCTLCAGALLVKTEKAVRMHALLWFGLVALPPILAATLRFSSATAPSMPPWLLTWASFSPLQWWWEGVRGSIDSLPLLPLCSALLLLLPAWNPSRERSEEL